MMKNGILTFLFAFCPGAGQMYQGYMKRPFAHYDVLRGLWCGNSAGSFVCSHAHCVDVQLL